MEAYLLRMLRLTGLPSFFLDSEGEARFTLAYEVILMLITSNSNSAGSSSESSPIRES